MAITLSKNYIDAGDVLDVLAYKVTVALCFFDENDPTYYKSLTFHVSSGEYSVSYFDGLVNNKYVGNDRELAIKEYNRVEDDLE